MTDTFTTPRKKVTLPADAVLDELIHDQSPEILIAVAGVQNWARTLPSHC